MRLITCVMVLAAACSEPITVKWKRSLQAPSVSTPLVTDQFIAVGHELGVSVVEPDGKPRCVFKTHRDVISAPKTDGKRIYFGSTNYIFYAIDPRCTEVWRFPTGDRIKSDPLVTDDAVFVSSYDGHLYKLDAETGQPAWKFPPAPPPRLDLPPSEPEPEPERPAKGKKKGKQKEETAAPEPPPPPPPPPKAMLVGDFSYSSPVINEGVVYVGNLDHHLYAVDATSGELRGRFKTEGPVTSTPAIANGRIFFGSNDGNVYAIDLVTNTMVWTFRTQDWVNSSPRIDGAVLYVGSNDRHVYAVEHESGRLKWKAATEGPAISIPGIYKNLVIAAGASGDGRIYALQREDGKEFWRYATDGKIESDPVIIGDALYISSADANLYRFELRRTTAK